MKILLTILLLLLYIELLLPVLKIFRLGPVAGWSWERVTAPIWGPWVLIGLLVLLGSPWLRRYHKAPSA